MARPVKLSDEEIAARIAELPGWELADGKLHRRLEFPSFVRAFGFMSALALVAIMSALALTSRRRRAHRWSTLRAGESS